MSHSLITLTRGFAATCKPEHLTLADIDRLYSTICCVLIEQPQHVDLIALEQLATDLDNHRKHRTHGNELAA